MDFENLVLIMPVGDIPDQSVVTKVTGQKEFVVRKSFRLWSEVEGQKQIPIQIADGCVVLVSRDSGDACVVAGTTLMKWKTSLRSLQFHESIGRSK